MNLVREPEFWPEGAISATARKLGIRAKTLSGIINRRLTPRLARAKALQKVTGVSWWEWMDNKTSKHPAFKGKAKK